MAVISGNFSADGVSAQAWCDNNKEGPEGVYIKLYGDFGGGIVTVEEDQGDGTYVAKECGSFSSNGEKRVLMPNGTKFRIRLSGSTSPDLNYYIANMAYRGKY